MENRMRGGREGGEPEDGVIIREINGKKPGANVLFVHTRVVLHAAS